MAIYWDKGNKNNYPLDIKELDEIITECLTKVDLIEVGEYLNKEADMAKANHGVATRKKLTITYKTESMYSTLQGVCNFFNTGGIPATVSKSDFQKLKPIVQMLVEKKIFKSEVLTHFE